MTIMVLNKDPGNTANVTFNLTGFSATTYTTYTVASTNPGSISLRPQPPGARRRALRPTASPCWWSAEFSLQARLGVVFESGRSDDSGLGNGILNPKIVSGTAPVTLNSAVFDAFEGATACSGSLALTNPTITPTTRPPSL